jgi:predicted secreted protein
MATVLAKNMTISVDGVEVTCQTNAEINMSTETFDTTCKDSGAWSEPRPGTKSWTASGEFNVDNAAALGAKQFFNGWDSQVLVDIIFGTGSSFEYEGSGYITSLTTSSQGNDAAVTGTFEITGAGPLTYAS